MSARKTAAVVVELCAAGIDFVKDAELQANGPSCPFYKRAQAVMAVINAHADKTGRQVMYAVNLTGEVDEMRARHDLVADPGGTCVMPGLDSIGLTGILALRRHAGLPIHAYRNGWCYLSRHPALGFDYRAWSVFWRLAGADHLHVNGIVNRSCKPDDSVIASARAVTAPPSLAHPAVVMPVFSSGQVARQAHATWAALGHAGLVFAAGSGIMAHPGGPEGGVRSIRDAWEAAMAGISLDHAARESRALGRALERYGP